MLCGVCYSNTDVLHCITMKAVKAIFFLLCFLIGNSGMVVSAHWCGGKLTHISFLVEHDDCSCGKKVAEMKPDCCKDKVTTLKAEDDLNTTSAMIFKASVFKEIIIAASHVEIIAASFFHYSAPEFYRPPPDTPRHPVYLLNRVFLI
jgi:hypothetical protein